jgi:hypothetical protein
MGIDAPKIRLDQCLCNEGSIRPRKPRFLKEFCQKGLQFPGINEDLLIGH